MTEIAVTPNFGLRYPACPDCQPCPDCPGGLDAFENLARDVDTALVGLDGRLTTVEATLVALDARLTVVEATLAGQAPIFARKTADESVTSSTTLQDDNELFVQVAANTVYHYEMMLRVDATAASDIKSQFTVPAGTVLRTALDAVALGGSTFQLFDLNDTATEQTEGAGAGSIRDIIFAGLVITAGTAGQLTLQWAQQTSGGTATIVKAGSYLWLQKMV